MNTQSDAMPESFEAQRVAPAVLSPTRPMYWSLRRELWEYRSIYIAPLAVAAVALFSFTISIIAGIWERPLRFDPGTPQKPFDMAAGLLMLTGIIVSAFYCVDALHGERRDRSILFWKSLPVSDITTVLSKASIPLVILPLLTFAITIAVQWVMLLVSTAVVLVSGQSVAMLWSKFVILPDVAVAALSSVDGSCALARAHLLLAAAGIRLGSPRAISVGGVTAGGDRRRREPCVSHVAFRCAGGRSIHRRRADDLLHRAGYVPHQSHDTYHSGSFPEQPGSLDRAGDHCGIPRRSRPAAPLSRTDLSRMHLI